MTQLFLCSWQSITWPCPQTNDTALTVFTVVHYLTMFWDKCYTCYSVHNNPLLEHILSQIIHPLLCSQQSTAWLCSEPNDRPVAVFTTFHHLFMFWIKWHACYSVHNSQPLDNVLNQIIHCYCVQNSPQLDYVLSQIKHMLLCPKLSTAWPSSEPNDTPVTVFTTVQILTMSSPK
jgi:hypothetical protein